MRLKYAQAQAWTEAGRALEYANTLKHLTRAEYDRELAERANRADAVIATVSVFGLVIVQLAKKGGL